MNTRKAHEGPIGCLDASDVLAEVKLGYLVSFTIASIRDSHGYPNCHITAGCRGVYHEVIVAKAGVAKAEAKGKEGLAVVVDIFANA